MLSFAELPEAWQGFIQACNSCRECPLGEQRQNIVVYRGALDAPMMIIGEGPGKEEDRLGVPFVGRSGRLLDSLLEALEFTEDDYHIGNIVKCRPPGNRNPSREEAEACKRLLAAQFKLVKPQVILLSGKVAYQYFTGRDDPISKVRGHWIENKGFSILPTFHPAYVLRNPNARTELWHDLAMARERLEDLDLIAPMSVPLSDADFK